MGTSDGIGKRGLALCSADTRSATFARMSRGAGSRSHVQAGGGLMEGHDPLQVMTIRRFVVGLSRRCCGSAAMIGLSSPGRV
jgi:hypothetical protein